VVGKERGGRRNFVRVDEGDDTPPGGRAGPGAGRECIRIVARFKPHVDGEGSVAGEG